MPETKSREEFISLIEKGVESSANPERFRQLELEIKYIEQRNYPCARVREVAEDQQALIRPGQHGIEIMQNESLYCRHPVRQDTGFAITYSYRGASIYKALTQEADGFIKGVQVPGH